MRKLWRRFLAYWRLDLSAVCEMSKSKGYYDDYHDYPDAGEQNPYHWQVYYCKRCGKGFYI